MYIIYLIFLLVTSAGLNEENCQAEFKQFGVYMARMQDYIQTKILFPFIPTEFWLRFFPSGKQFSKARTDALNIIANIIAKRRSQDCEIQDNEVLATDNSDRGKPLFDLILEDNSKKLEEIFEEIVLFTTAATDTTAGTLSFCFTLLGMFPEVQEVVYKEVVDHVGTNNIVNEDISNLKYTEAVILETLRFFPSGPFLVRFAEADVDIGKKTIPVGTNIIIDIFHLHRDEEYWPNPMKFDPSRFLPENASEITPYTFIPFSAGARDCIGKAVGMMVMKIALANVIRNYKIISNHKSIEDIPLTSAVSLRAVGHLDCQFVSR